MADILIRGMEMPSKCEECMLIRYLDTTEDMMIYLLEHRDTPGTSKADVRMCNRLWRECAVLYSLLK